MKNGDEVEVLTGKYKGCFGVLMKGFTQKKHFNMGGTALIKKVVVRFDEIGKTATYSRYNIRKAN